MKIGFLGLELEDFHRENQETVREQQTEKGFEPKSAKVNFVLFWTKEDTGKEIQLVLPELHFEKVR